MLGDRLRDRSYKISLLKIKSDQVRMRLEYPCSGPSSGCTRPTGELLGPSWSRRGELDPNAKDIESGIETKGLYSFPQLLLCQVILSSF